MNKIDTEISLNTPLWLSLFALFCLIVCVSLILSAFTKKHTSSLFTGAFMGIIGLGFAIFSTIKAINILEIQSQNALIDQSKTSLIFAFSINGLYLVLLIILFLFLFWIFKGYRHGL